MRALITGATVSSGRTSRRHLRACGDDFVIPGDADGGFDIVDRDIVHAAFDASQPEVVYHMAARSDVAESLARSVGTLRINVERNPERARCGACVRARGACSSSEARRSTDPTMRSLREDHPLRPATPYGASKVAASFLALQAFLGSGLETIRVRTVLAYGTGTD
jgi:nucleoside-diphosphate-sugar epimerase